MEGIYRRNGNEGKAKNLFDEVLSLIENNKDQEFIYNLTIQLKINLKENF